MILLIPPSTSQCLLIPLNISQYLSVPFEELAKLPIKNEYEGWHTQWIFLILPPAERAASISS
jgi:hypothetical protein